MNKCQECNETYQYPSFECRTHLLKAKSPNLCIKCAHKHFVAGCSTDYFVRT